MAASIPPSIAAEAILIMAGKALVFAMPVLAVAALWWLADRIDLIIARLFPLLEWERNLGWLNIRAERRAQTALRWLGVAIYLTLAAALVGMVWETRQITDQLTALAAWPDFPASSYVLFRMAKIVLYLGCWLIFFGYWLIPKIRAEREGRELRQFRAEMKEKERASERQPRAKPQLVSKYQKPRSDSSIEAMLGQPGRMRRQPGE